MACSVSRSRLAASTPATARCCSTPSANQCAAPVHRTVSVSGGGEILLGRFVYGDLLSSPQDTNHVGRVYRVYDGAGVATTVEFDFKGNALEEQRQLVDDETSQPDWSDLITETTISAMASAASSLLDAETFSATTERDALGRVLTAISPDDSEVIYTYDEGGALQKVEVKHRGSATAETVVGDITYNARGQRESVVYGTTSSPATTTTYTYDPQTYRLASLTTVRDSDSAELQELYYHYDPVGNVTDIRDESQQTVYFQNSVVEAANTYTYDAVCRLIEATGREHSTQGTSQRTDVQIVVGPQPMTTDPSAMRRYTQKYTYDEVGNIEKMQHIPGTGTGWTRYYAYDSNGNRLDSTSIPADDPEGPYSDSYSYDNHGNMTAMPHLSSMVWNHNDELQEVTVGSETVYFQYAGGQRSRKYVEKTGTTTEERIYLGPFEIYRKRQSGSLELERESLHISDGSGRICIIETKTVEDGTPVGSPTGIWRIQHSNHLGSAATEVDETGAIISYEEYHPYGTSSYRAVDSSIDVSAKRYRYTGMERDEETSLEYHTARYYAPWLGRWTAVDSMGLSDGPNRYVYAKCSPASRGDLNGRKTGSLTGILKRKFGFGEEEPQPEITGGGDAPDPEVDADTDESGSAPGSERAKPKPKPKPKPGRIDRAKRKARYYADNPGDIVGDLVSTGVDAYAEHLDKRLVEPGKAVLQRGAEMIGGAIRTVQDPLAVAEDAAVSVFQTAEELNRSVGRMVDSAKAGDGSGVVDAYGDTAKATWGLIAAAYMVRSMFRGRGDARATSGEGAVPPGGKPPPPKPKAEAGGKKTVATDAAPKRGVRQLVTSGAEVTDELIRQAMKDAPLKTRQGGVSVPTVRAYVDRLAAGDVAPPIQVADGVIIEGNHRYIAGRLFGKEPAQIAGAAAPSQASRPTVSWGDIFLDPFDWGNR